MARTPISALAGFAPCTVNIRGKVSYSHISKMVDGTELANTNQRRLANGLTPYDKPYSALTIQDAYIVDDGTLNPTVKAVLEERFGNKTNPDGTISKVWYGTSKSPTLPPVAYGAEAGNDAGKGIADKDVPLTAELATGLDVTIGVKIYKGKIGTGLGMDYVLVNEPIRYYTASGIQKALEQQGLTYAAPTGEVKADTTPVAVSPMANVAPVPQAVTPQPVAQQPAATPVQQVAPVPQQAAPQQMQAQASPMVGTFPQGGANYAQPTQNVAPQQAAPQEPALRYNPN